MYSIKSFLYLKINNVTAITPTKKYVLLNINSNNGIFSNDIPSAIKAIELLNICAIIDGTIDLDLIAINPKTIPISTGLTN